MRILNTFFALFLVTTLISLGCAKTSESFNDNNQSASSKRRLYVASGSCYAGGVTTSAGALTVAAFNLEDGKLERVVIDYNTISPGDTPIGIVEYDADRILVLVENTSGRRIDLVNKDGSQLSTFLLNSTALSGVVRKLVQLTDGSLLVSKSTAVEKFSAAKARITQGVNPFINAPAGTCATATTLISSMSALSNGKILYTHAAATPNNKISIISADGYAIAGDCLTSLAAPTTVAMPTSTLIHSSGKLLVSYGSTTTSSNFIYGYDVNVTSNAITNATVSYYDAASVNGPTVMTEDPSTGEVFVANGNSTFNTIQKFTFAPSTRILTRHPGQPFIPSQIYTRCVSDMKVLSE